MQPPFHRLEEYAPLDPEAEQLIEDWTSRAIQLERNTFIRSEGQPVNGVYFLLDGWVASSILVRNGKRQVVKVHLRGDMLGWPSLALERTGESLQALTDVSVVPISNKELALALKSGSNLVDGLILSTQRERVALMHELSWIGTAKALERMAAFFLDLFDRLGAAGLVEGNGFPMPLTQLAIADLLGLTAVHVNRTLRELEKRELIRREKGWIDILDHARLRALAPNELPRYGGREAWRRIFVQPNLD